MAEKALGKYQLAALYAIIPRSVTKTARPLCPHTHFESLCKA